MCSGLFKNFTINFSFYVASCWLLETNLYECSFSSFAYEETKKSFEGAHI